MNGLLKFLTLLVLSQTAFAQQKVPLTGVSAVTVWVRPSKLNENGVCGFERFRIRDRLISTIEAATKLKVKEGFVSVSPISMSVDADVYPIPGKCLYSLNVEVFVHAKADHNGSEVLGMAWSRRYLDVADYDRFKFDIDRKVDDALKEFTIDWYKANAR